MLRTIPALMVLMLLSAACFGGGDKDAAPTATREAVATEAPASEAAEPTSEASDSGDEGDSEALGTVFESLLGGGLGGATGSAGSLGSGDPALKALLPSADQFPTGFTPFGEFTFSTPDGVSEGGSIDMAMSMAVSGDFA